MILHDHRHFYDFSKKRKIRRRFIRPIRDRMPYLPLAPLKPENLPNWKRIDYGVKHECRFRLSSSHPPTHAALHPVQSSAAPVSYTHLTLPTIYSV